MFARSNPAGAAPTALKSIQRLASNAGTDARAYASMFAQFALSTCGSHPLPRSVRPIGPRIAKSVLVLRGLVPPSLTVCDLKELQRRTSVEGFVFTDLSTDSDDASTAEPAATAPP